MDALQTLKTYFGVADGWRRENPTTVNFSFQMQNRPIQSRIDRIYIAENLIPFSWNWKIIRTAMSTDHTLVQATIIHPKQPHVGKGRYTMPILLLRDPKLIKTLVDIGKRHLTELKLSAQER